jgi:hypothetical protein
MGFQSGDILAFMITEKGALEVRIARVKLEFGPVGLDYKISHPFPLNPQKPSTSPCVLVLVEPNSYGLNRHDEELFFLKFFCFNF